MRTAQSLLIALGLCSVVTLTATTSAVVQAPTLAPACTSAMKSSIARCPETGCGRRVDALLNRMKNRVGVVSNPQRITLEQIRNLDEPRTFQDGAPRTDFAATEARGVVTTGFLLFAKRQKGESVNCGITGPTNTDIHLVLVDRLPEDLDDQGQIDEAEENSVTAEITPRVRRAGHPTWVVANINDFEDKFVRITGWLMLDTEHISRPLARATNWEIHPVTRFQVCNSTVARCRQGQGWRDF